MSLVRLFPAVLLVLAVAASSGPAAEPRGPFSPHLVEPDFYTGLLHQGVARVQKIEFVEMLSVILTKGSDMGPDDGWFHPSQSRYDWKWLATRYDTNRDGKITEDEFPGEEKFPRLPSCSSDSTATATARSPAPTSTGRSARPTSAS